jgi:hypothetical protein|tara:strand:+ start:735 stop:1334 length:600 start_codon:yes stop_codon:yes gene_type:complete
MFDRTTSMNIAITGHKNGIGKAIFNLLKKEGHFVVGYDIEEGFDIEDVSTQQEILDLSKDYDVFINNAHSMNSQIELFDMFFNEWQMQDNKHIINISSIEKLFPNPINNPQILVYTQQKKKLWKKAFSSIANRVEDRKVKISTVSPSLVKTALSDMYVDRNYWGKTIPMMQPVDVAKVVSFVLNHELEIIDITFTARQT